MYDELNNTILDRLVHLNGDWVRLRINYESYLCALLEMQLERTRYWDATWREHLIEFKKGTSIWLDLVRYSEIVLRENEAAMKETLCMFFVPAKHEPLVIDEVICVRTRDIIAKIGLTEEIAKSVVGLRDHVPRSLNAQASLTIRDVRSIATFISRSVRQRGRD